MANKQVITKVIKAKSKLTIKHPFFGGLAMRFPTVILEDDNPYGCTTMCTDGQKVFYNETFTEGLTVPEVIGVFAHEVSHIAYGHMFRIKGRNHQLWNIACDYAINPILKEAGLVLPKDHLDDPNYHGKSAEKIYSLLENEIGKKTGKTFVFPDGTTVGNGPQRVEVPGWGTVHPHPELGKAGQGKAEREVQMATIQAADVAKKKGKLPAAFDSLVSQYRAAKVDWRNFMRTWVQGQKPNDYSYRRINRLYAAMINTIVPTIENNGVGKIVFGIDSSGSVSKPEMEQFLGEIAAVHEDFSPDETVLIWCDADIQHVDRYSAWDTFDKKKRHGCGGTQLSPVFKYIEDNDERPDMMIFLTDLEVWQEEFAGIHPDYPVLWVSTSADWHPFGDLVKIEV